MAIAAMRRRAYHVETVPCTNRTQLLLRSPQDVGEACEYYFARFKQKHAHMILSGDDGRSVRVNRIVGKIAGAIHRGLGSKARGSLDWVRWLDWEVIVLRHDSANARSFMGGKIMIHTGLLRRLSSDAEIAAVLAHEVGHVIARHSSEMIRAFVERYRKSRLFPTFLAAPYFRRQELEADYIGIMLLAASGFDPHAALRALEKVGTTTQKPIFNRILSFLLPTTHPSCKERSRFLSRRKVMEEAMELYTQVIIRAG